MARAAACALLLLSLAAGAGEAPVSWERELGIGGINDGDGLGFSEDAAAAAADSAAVVRRVLQAKGYISYGAMWRGTTPCSVRGASYYNCRPGGQANPYSRGCSAITRCRG